MCCPLLVESFMSRRTILFAAGGSGGHLFPAIAVAEELMRLDATLAVEMVATDKAIDRTILARYPFGHHHLKTVSLTRIWRQPLKVLQSNWHAWQTARQLIREKSPAVVVGCGGFASVPLVWAAIRAGVPVMLMEQNLIPGRANAWLSRWADKVCLSFEETKAYLPSSTQHRKQDLIVTGNPVRKSMLPPASPPPRLPKQLLILGGSQGARHLNQAITEWVSTRPAELEGWHLIHQTGTADLGAVVQYYRYVNDFLNAEPVGFIADPSSLYRSATLVIARAGATSLAEIACQGTPAILVPLPSAARDHQTANARWYANQGAARVVIQSPTASETAIQLAAITMALLLNSDVRDDLSSEILRTARPQAALDCAKIILAKVS